MVVSRNWIELVEIDQYSIIEPAMKDIMIDVPIHRYDSVTAQLTGSVMINILFLYSNELSVRQASLLGE